ncbi:unnamed protein product [Brassicogethes aeneus]|uniref:Cation-transporting ATPase n=1 Tax=Brassicogethes aeneus TaxID=1431903 RepID=A0A9P0AUR8_BRAAE|nr:unnamed protein product [Brassicogethes aeneus]
MDDFFVTMGNVIRDFFSFSRKSVEDDKKRMEQEVELLKGSVSRENRMYINRDHDDEMEIFCYKSSKIKTTLTYLFFVLTAGILRLLYHWIPYLYLYSTSVRCKIQEAETILVLELYNGKHKIYHVETIKELTPDMVQKLSKIPTERLSTFPVHFENGIFREVEKLITFSCKKVIYIWDEERQEFIKLSGLDNGVSLKRLKDNKGLTSDEQALRNTIFGPNEIEVKVSSISKLLFLEVLNPYYIFQILSFILWFLDNYYIYASTIIIMSAISIVTSVRQTRNTEKKLKKTIHTTGNCVVLRKFDRNDDKGTGEGSTYQSEEVLRENLVPGDVIEISDNIMHCDAVLLTGSCIVNESMLTGESVPVTKTPVADEDIIYDAKEHARHTLFCGTKIIQSRNVQNQKVLAVVIRTGYSTTKGSLVRSIQFPPPVDFKFEKDSYKFIGMLAVVAFGGFIYTIVSKVMRGGHFRDLFIEACDLITIVVPPALPTAMTIGQLYSQKRLEKNKIFCISPRTINVAGSLNCVCFDKTGTLTEDGLDLNCVVPIESKVFSPPAVEVEKMDQKDFVVGMVCCHSLKRVKEEIVGDPLDLKMFNSTKWEFDEIPSMDMIVFKSPKGTSDEDSCEIGIIKEFPFSSSSQRMGVIASRVEGDYPPHFEFYCKGSPEMILNFVRDDSVPDNFQEVFEDYTHKGYRVIALAHKRLTTTKITKIKNMSREDVENDLTLLGLIVLENRLKPITQSCIRSLNDAKIRVIMVTGDNILTALSVAKKCDMITDNQSVITVNTDNNNPPNLYYTLTQTKSSKMPKDHSILSNSVSVNVETEETFINSVKEYKDSVNYNNYRFAMTGKTWAILKEYHPELLQKIVARGSIFARMSPENKQQLVQELQGIGYIVAMCGDGANDCGALKAAHTGISLSEAESSVASPFTSQTSDISCVEQVIREGRAGLVTSFGIFKYMAAYSMCQFTSVLILYSMDLNLTDMEFLFIDLGIIATFTYFFGKTESYNKLVKETPLSSLISIIPIFSLFCHMVFVVLFQTASFQYLKTQPWYEPFNGTGREDKDDNASMENYTVYTISSFQYIILAIVFSKGKPYRKSVLTNYGFIIGALIMTVTCVYMSVWPCTFITNLFQLHVVPDVSFRWTLVVFAAINFTISMFMEYVVIDNYLFKKYHKNDESKRKYLEIERQLQKDTKWPMLSDYISEASPMIASPTATVEIVYEKGKFEKNHVLNKLYNTSDSQTSLNKVGDKLPNGYLPNGDIPSPLRQVENGFYSQDDLQFSSLPSNNFSSESGTFKSVTNGTNFDLANSQDNIADLPYDDYQNTKSTVSLDNVLCNGVQSSPINKKLESLRLDL